MAVFDHIPAGEEGLREVYRWLDDFVARHENVAHKEIIGRSDENRDIPAIFLTNANIPERDKEMAIITLARHGQEAGTRVVGPEIINYLGNDDAKEILDSQVVIVVPVVNPDGFVRNDFHSSLTRLTRTERTVLGRLFHAHPPDMMLDYHSLGKVEGSRFDSGDMEAIIPANTTRWAMDEQIHQYAAQRMRDAAEKAGWPYEIHTLEETSAYYFGDRGVGGLPWTFLQEKVYLLHMQDFHDNYDIPQGAAYTNYTCGPAYMKWHTLVFGIETNHWSIPDAGQIAESGLFPCKTMLKLGCSRFPWEKDVGYPVNIVHGDFRNSIRAMGRNTEERRASRTRIWGERKHFNMPQREMLDQETTCARVRYFGRDLPMEFALCLRMRQRTIKAVAVQGKAIPFETFRDPCSTFLYIPITMDEAGTLELTIKH
ncbi:MAG: hypothetical protein JXL84_16895 [Deltaproteobacteria bacterium]|nr:hypothetical protein [Deltaproteobacteria bacterium]